MFFRTLDVNAGDVNKFWLARKLPPSVVVWPMQSHEISTRCAALIQAVFRIIVSTLLFCSQLPSHFAARRYVMLSTPAWAARNFIQFYYAVIRQRSEPNLIAINWCFVRKLEAPNALFPTDPSPPTTKGIQKPADPPTTAAVDGGHTKARLLPYSLPLTDVAGFPWDTVQWPACQRHDLCIKIQHVNEWKTTSVSCSNHLQAACVWTDGFLLLWDIANFTLPQNRNYYRPTDRYQILSKR